MLSPLIVLSLFLSVASAKNVFAHVVVGNTAAHTKDTWTTDISLAKSSGIDAFVLNIAYPDGNIPSQVANAFAAAEAAGSGFKLFFAFDYLGGGLPWPAAGDNSVSSYLNQYKSSPAYFKYKEVPMASTFEGVNNIGDWNFGGPIRNSAGDVFFVPDWTSLGPGGIGSHLNTIQGAFSWDMWPNGPRNMTTDADKAWKGALGAKPFMMGVSPWFFNSATGGRDWVWRGDDLWADRWAQTLEVNPEFVQIVTWNDFGEASYIGPIHFDSEIAAGSGIYTDGMPHDAWRDFLPYYIAKYKGSKFTISKDQVQYWYRPAPAAAGSTCGITGNNADQGQQLYSPSEILQDGVFFSALLKEDAQVTVSIGDGPKVSFSGSQGINHWSVPFGGQTGAPSFKVVRNGATAAAGKGLKAITEATTLSNGCTNYNAFVGSF